MFKKEIIILTIGLLLLTTISGCLESLEQNNERSYCKKVEEETISQGHDCRCFESRNIPKDLENQSVRPKCICSCLINGTRYNISVVQSPGAEKTKVMK